MRKTKREVRKWKENTFVNLGSTKIAVLFCERCKHRYDTESFFSKLLFYKFLCKILLGFHRSSKTRSKLTEVKSTFSFQFAVCVRSWQFDNCHYLTHMYCSLFKGFPGIVGKTVAITTYFIAANMRVWYKTKKNPTHKACSRCVKKNRDQKRFSVQLPSGVSWVYGRRREQLFYSVPCFYSRPDRSSRGCIFNRSRVEV